MNYVKFNTKKKVKICIFCFFFIYFQFVLVTRYICERKYCRNYVFGIITNCISFQLYQARKIYIYFDFNIYGNFFHYPQCAFIFDDSNSVCVDSLDIQKQDFVISFTFYGSIAFGIFLASFGYPSPTHSCKRNSDKNKLSRSFLVYLAALDWQRSVEFWSFNEGM